jgi:hypothetical protein
LRLQRPNDKKRGTQFKCSVSREGINSIVSVDAEYTHSVKTETQQPENTGEDGQQRTQKENNKKALLEL